LRKAGKVYDKEIPNAGDLVFFHNTSDRNKDHRNNDWYSMIGIVEKVDDDGSVTFITFSFGQVKRFVMNLYHPQVRREEKTGKVLNDFLRIKRLDDPEYTQYLSGELYAGFGAL
jgi:hypothetical protein